MSEIKGSIDTLVNNNISGWVTGNCPEKIDLYCGETKLGSLDKLFLRQDVIDAGLCEGDAGFNFNASTLLNNISGKHEFTLKIGDNLITQKEFNVPRADSLLKNSYFELDAYKKIKSANFNVSHRVGLNLESFIAPVNLELSNGFYTRISFSDTHNTRELFEVEFELDDGTLNQASDIPLEVGIVARTVVPCNVHLRLLDQQDTCILDEPVFVQTIWNLNTIVLCDEHSRLIRERKCKVSFRIKHHGRRHIDIAMFAISESVTKLKTPVQLNQEKEAQLEQLTNKTTNILENGNLDLWNRGIDFSNLKRGQELADNWFIEFNKSNLGKISALVSTDNIQSDPLSASIKNSFGIRFCTKELDGYARVVTPINIVDFVISDYKFTLDIEASGIDKKSVLPRIYFAGRDAYDDTILYDVDRKKSLNGRQVLEYSLSAQIMENMLKNAANKAGIVLMIDLPNRSDITIYGARLSIDNANISSSEIEIKKVVDNSSLTFEDTSITEQLHLLKGLDSWSNKVEALGGVKHELADNVLSGLNEFEQHIFSLSAHEMERPSRNFATIDIIVPVYNACDDVLLCLSSLVEKTDLLHRVIIVNDGEELRTSDMLHTFARSYNHFSVINNEENIGYTKSVNKGIKASNADWVVILNSDTIVSEGWLGKLMNCALTEEKVGMVGPLSNAASWQSVPKIHDESGDWHLNPLPEGVTIDEFASYVERLSIREYPQVGVINGFCQLINMNLLDEIGLLDEVAFPVGYGEENDMCARAVKAGYTLLIADDTYVYHSKSKSFGHSQRKKLAKEGSIALKNKHPDVDWGQVTSLIRENEELNKLREQLVAELENFEKEGA